jgi:hypothetical protein
MKRILIFSVILFSACSINLKEKVIYDFSENLDCSRTQNTSKTDWEIQPNMFLSDTYSEFIDFTVIANGKREKYHLEYNEQRTNGQNEIYFYDVYEQIGCLHSPFSANGNAIRIDDKRKIICFKPNEVCSSFTPFWDFPLSDIYKLLELNQKEKPISVSKDESFKNKIIYYIERKSERNSDTISYYIVLDKKSKKIQSLKSCKGKEKIEVIITNRKKDRHERSYEYYFKDIKPFEGINTPEQEHNFDNERVQLSDKYKGYIFKYVTDCPLED